jgi:hypothetical protein
MARMQDRLGGPSGSLDRPRVVRDRRERLRRPLVRLREQEPVGDREQGQNDVYGCCTALARQRERSSR